MSGFVSNQTQVKVRVIADDGQCQQAYLSESFEVSNNLVSILEYESIEGTTRDITTNLLVNSAINNLDSFVVEYSLDDGNTYQTPISVTFNLDQIAEGIVSFDWQSYLDFQTKEETIKLRVTPVDQTGYGFPEISRTFAVNNNQIPLVQLHELQGDSDIVSLSYSFQDADNQLCDIQLGYSFDGGRTYQNTTNLSGEIEKLGNGSYNLQWNSVLDIPETQPYVMVRISANDGYDTGSTESVVFAINNNQLPEISNIRIAGTSGEIEIKYDLFDANQDICDLALYYQLDTTSSFLRAHVDGDSLANIANGSDHVVLWNTKTDGVVHSENTIIRLTAHDGKNEVVAGETSSVYLSNNTAPVVSNLEIRGETGEILITFDLADADNQLMDVALSYSLNGTDYLPVSDYYGTTTGLKNSFANRIYWNSGEIGNISSEVRLKIRANDVLVLGQEVISEQFNVTNSTLPVLSDLTIVGINDSSEVTVSYRLSDPDYDTCAVRLYFSVNDGEFVYAVSSNEVETTDTQQLHQITWSSLYNIHLNQTNVKVKLVPFDGTGYGSGQVSESFALNNDSGVALNTEITAVTCVGAGGMMDFSFDMTSEVFYPHQINIEYSLDNLTWNPLGTVSENEVYYPGSHTLQWDSSKVISESGTMSIRLTPYVKLDMGGYEETHYGKGKTSESFFVNNAGLPILDITNTKFNDIDNRLEFSFGIDVHGPWKIVPHISYDGKTYQPLAETQYSGNIAGIGHSVYRGVMNIHNISTAGVFDFKFFPYEDLENGRMGAVVYKLQVAVGMNKGPQVLLSEPPPLDNGFPDVLGIHLTDWNTKIISSMTRDFTTRYWPPYRIVDSDFAIKFRLQDFGQDSCEIELAWDEDFKELINPSMTHPNYQTTLFTSDKHIIGELDLTVSNWVYAGNRIVHTIFVNAKTLLNSNFRGKIYIRARNVFNNNGVISKGPWSFSSETNGNEFVFQKQEVKNLLVKEMTTNKVLRKGSILKERVKLEVEFDYASNLAEPKPKFQVKLSGGEIYRVKYIQPEDVNRGKNTVEFEYNPTHTQQEVKAEVVFIQEISPKVSKYESNSFMIDCTGSGGNLLYRKLIYNNYGELVTPSEEWWLMNEAGVQKFDFSSLGIPPNAIFSYDCGYYTYSENDIGMVWLVNRTNRNIRHELTTGSKPRISRLSNRVLYNNNRGSLTVYDFEHQTTKEAHIHVDARDNYDINYNGTEIVFDRAGKIYRHDIRYIYDSNFSKQPPVELCDGSYPSYSMDGSTVIFANNGCCMINVTGSNFKRISNRYHTNMSLSEDGHYVYLGNGIRLSTAYDYDSQPEYATAAVYETPAWGVQYVCDPKQMGAPPAIVDMWVMNEEGEKTEDSEFLRGDINLGYVIDYGSEQFVENKLYYSTVERSSGVWVDWKESEHFDDVVGEKVIWHAGDEVDEDIATNEVRLKLVPMYNKVTMSKSDMQGRSYGQVSLVMGIWKTLLGISCGMQYSDFTIDFEVHPDDELLKKYYEVGIANAFVTPVFVSSSAKCFRTDYTVNTVNANELGIKLKLKYSSNISSLKKRVRVIFVEEDLVVHKLNPIHVNGYAEIFDDGFNRNRSRVYLIYALLMDDEDFKNVTLGSNFDQVTQFCDSSKIFKTKISVIGADFCENDSTNPVFNIVERKGDCPEVCTPENYLLEGYGLSSRNLPLPVKFRQIVDWGLKGNCQFDDIKKAYYAFQNGCVVRSTVYPSGIKSDEIVFKFRRLATGVSAGKGNFLFGLEGAEGIGKHLANTPWTIVKTKKMEIDDNSINSKKTYDFSEKPTVTNQYLYSMDAPGIPIYLRHPLLSSFLTYNYSNFRYQCVTQQFVQWIEFYDRTSSSYYRISPVFEWSSQVLIEKTEKETISGKRIYLFPGYTGNPNFIQKNHGVSLLPIN